MLAAMSAPTPTLPLSSGDLEHDRLSGARGPAPASSAVIAAVIVVLILSAAVRLYELQQPRGLVFDEVFYAKDAHAILHGYLGPNPLYPWEPGAEVSWPHPEYGKLAIALGEAFFGDVAFGWRIAPALIGTLLLALVYPLGRRLGLAPPWALLGLILAASDFMGIVQSRIAMLDIFVAFWSLLCIFLALRYVQSGHRRRWLLLCGLAGGLALGTKWSGAFALAAAAAIILLYRRRPWQRPATAAVRQALRDLVLPAAALVALPAALYVASYTVYFMKGHHTLAQWWQLQHEMWWFNAHLHAANGAASRAYLWIFDDGGIWYLDKQSGGGVHAIVSMGNPLLWWAALPALIALAVLAIVRRERELALLPLIVALLYLPWPGTTRTSFIYYMTPVAPFLALAVAMVLRGLSHAQLPRRRWAALCYAATAGAGLLWHPITAAAVWLFWRLAAQTSLDLARAMLAAFAMLFACGLLAFVLRLRGRMWPYLTWVYAGAVTGVCLACLPILLGLPIPAALFHQLTWFGR
jgi:dolichyl-phosphate-mannose--protein O-mannosyl transferase